MPFKDPLASLTQQTHILWRLDRPMCYEGRSDEWEVPEGYITDLASVPRLAAWLIPRYGVYTPAAILHDYLCEAARWDEPLVTRADADGLFRRCLRELGVSAPRRWMMWAAVRAASRLSDARLKDIFFFALIMIPSVVFIAIPAAAVQVFLVLFWLVELVAWGIHSLLGRERPERPMLPNKI